MAIRKQFVEMMESSIDVPAGEEFDKLQEEMNDLRERRWKIARSLSELSNGKKTWIIEGRLAVTGNGCIEHEGNIMIERKEKLGEG